WCDDDDRGSEFAGHEARRSTRPRSRRPRRRAGSGGGGGGGEEEEEEEEKDASLARLAPLEGQHGGLLAHVPVAAREARRLQLRRELLQEGPPQRGRGQDQVRPRRQRSLQNGLQGGPAAPVLVQAVRPNTTSNAPAGSRGHRASSPHSAACAATRPRGGPPPTSPGPVAAAPSAPPSSAPSSAPPGADALAFLSARAASRAARRSLADGPLAAAASAAAAAASSASLS
ncbi:unnamed protein product, partial [Prorocentrum cordatum]